MNLDLSPCVTKPFRHQLVGIESLYKLEDPSVGRIYPGCFGLFDEMGAGKTLQTVVSTLLLYLDDSIRRVVVIAPASVRDVWYDADLGELRKHVWPGLRSRVIWYHSRRREWSLESESSNKLYRQAPLEWVITNYEFIRSAERLEQLKGAVGGKTLLVLDESSAIKNHRAAQTKACLVLRKRAARVVLLNGTPIANNPLDMYAQGQMMDPRILAVKNFFHFRAKYAVLGGWMQKQIIAWQNLEDLQQRFAPYVLRRLKVDCLDLPPKMPPTLLDVPLKPETWAIYREMRDDMVTWLSNTTVAMAAQAGVKAMRLAQICAGFLGGIMHQESLEPTLDELEVNQDRPDYVPRTFDNPDDRYTDREMGPLETREVGREKLEAFFEWLHERLSEDKDLKLLVWCRFRPELARLVKEISTRSFRRMPRIGTIWGGQKREERGEALNLLDPRTAPSGPVIVVGTPASGSMGLNLAAAHHVIYMSNDFSLKTRLQSEDRVHRPGQVYPVSYTDVVATGPAGQKTVDHLIMKALRNKEDIATWTTKAWIRGLTEE